MNILNKKYRIIKYSQESIDEWMQFKEKYPEHYERYIREIRESGEDFKLLEVDSVSRSEKCENCPYKVYREHPWGYSYLLDCEWWTCYEGKSREEIKELLAERERENENFRKQMRKMFPEVFGEQEEETKEKKIKEKIVTTKEPKKVVKKEKNIMPKKEEKEVEKKYKIVTLCGSTKFKPEFEKITEKLTIQGNIVLAPGEYTGFNNINPDSKEMTQLDDDTIEMLKDLHKEKIRMADEVLIINKDGYIGETTKEEIQFALSIGKPVFYIENSVEETCLNKLKFVLDTQNKKLSDEAIDAIANAIIIIDGYTERSYK